MFLYVTIVYPSFRIHSKAKWKKIIENERKIFSLKNRNFRTDIIFSAEIVLDLYGPCDHKDPKEFLSREI